MATRAISGTSAPSNNPFASASLYVGDLASDVTEATLFELFNAVGPVASIRVCRDATTRRSLGYAYVNFHSVQDAERALDTMNFTNIRGKQCRIMWSQRDPRLRQSGKGNIFVKNLHESIDNKTLYDTFSVFGNILSCKVVMDKNDGKSRGYGYVHYVDDKSATKAIEGVNGMKISDREVHAELFKPREERMKNFKFTNVYVKYIPAEMTQKALKILFETETGGEVTDLFLWKHEYGTSACLNFKDADTAKLAVDKLNGREIKNIDLRAGDEDIDTGNDDKGGLNAEKKEETVSDDKVKPEEKDDEETTSDDKVKEEEENKDDKGGIIEKKEDPPQEPQPVKLYVARAQKRQERKEFLARQSKRRGVRSGGRGNYTGANLYVKNLSLDVDDTKLKDMFASFGSITSAKVMRENNLPNGKSRGFGFVAFDKKEAATRAIHEMTNTLHHGKPLYVSRAQTKAFRQRFIIKQLRNKRMRNQNNNYQGGQGGGGYGGGRGGYSGGRGGQQQGGYGGQQGGYGGQQQQPPSYGGPGPQQGFGGGFSQHQQQRAMQQQFGMVQPQQMQQQQRGFAANPMYGGMNPMLLQQQQQQALIAQQQQQALAQRQQQAMIAHQQAMLSQNQPGIGSSAVNQQQLATSSINQAMSSQQQQHLVSQHQRSASMGQTQQSQPAQSLQSGPQSASIYSSQKMVSGTGGNIAGSVPHQSSVPTGQHSVSQLSAGGGASAPVLEVNPLTSEMLKDAKPAEKKRLIGERLFPKIQVVEPRLAGKITGMLLEMDNTELLVLLSDQRALMNKINEALAVLKDHQQKQSQQNPGSTKNPSSQNPAVGSQNN